MVLLVVVHGDDHNDDGDKDNNDYDKIMVMTRIMVDDYCNDDDYDDDGNDDDDDGDDDDDDNDHDHDGNDKLTIMTMMNIIVDVPLDTKFVRIIN